ncbi:MAG: hypothetical protein PVF49_02910 [Anaerolineales bacterium]|jgi:hypothetical protein
MKKVPFHPFLFAIYPIIFLLATNINEVAPSAAIRSLLVALLLALILLLVTRLILKQWRRAALVTTWLLILFFSYGHIYQFLRQVEIFGLDLGRHRFLVPAYAVVGALVGWRLLSRSLDDLRWTLVFNIMGLVLLIYPGYQIMNSVTRDVRSQTLASIVYRDLEGLSPPTDEPLPDIYYIILDTYTRADALRLEYSFDNQPFLDELQEMGFYIAECSRSNYPETFGSLTSSLNMEYIPDLTDRVFEAGFSGGDVRGMLANNRVRYQLENLGYRVVASDTYYDWSRWDTADVYLSLSDTGLLQSLEPFEAMVIKSTLGMVITDAQYKLQMANLEAQLGGANFPFAGFARNQLFLLDQLEGMGAMKGPKLVFAHILIPHVPRVFAPDGSIVTDPGFYAGDMSGAVNSDYDIRGYLNEIQFINSRMLDIVTAILDESEVEPIIILQGDTGHAGTNKYQILNAIYMPGGASDELYSTMTPVNTFRVIFNTFFGADLALLPDISYDGHHQIPETSSTCSP